VPQDLTTVRVLIVDDNAHMRSILKTVLDTAGIHDVREAADGSMALMILSSWRADVAVVDYHMAPMNGIELTKRLRSPEDSPDPTLPVVMITGHADTQRVLEARQAGITEFVVKPVTAKNVLEKLNAALGKRSRAAPPQQRVHWVG
jgi:CheY-like chemotaxis protein